MTIKISLHQTHRQYTNGKEIIEVEGKTVGECLKDLVKKYPPLEKEIFKQGQLNSLIEIYIDGASAYPNEMAKAVKEGDEIDLVYMISGG